MIISEIVDREGSSLDYRTGGDHINLPDGSIAQTCPQCKGSGKEGISRPLQRNNNEFMQGGDTNPTKICTNCHGKGYTDKVEGKLSMGYNPDDYESIKDFKAGHPEIYQYILDNKKGNLNAKQAIIELKKNGSLSVERFRKIEGAMNNKANDISDDAGIRAASKMKTDKRWNDKTYSRTAGGHRGRHK